VNRFHLESAVDPLEVKLQVDYYFLYHLIMCGQTFSIGWINA
jgi:hypothetical protein